MNHNPWPKAILLDLDDTILAFSAGAEECWISICQDFAPQLDGISAEQLLDAIDNRRKWYWNSPERHRKGRMDLNQARREVVQLTLSQLNVERPGLAIAIADAYSTARSGSVKLFPGAVDAIHHFRSQGIKLALITNGTSEDQRAKIDKFGLEPLFDCILIEGEFGLGKPDERVYHHVLKALNVGPHEAWMVGDNLVWEIETPQRLGIYAIWNDWAGSGLPADTNISPDRIVHSLSELIQEEY